MTRSVVNERNFNRLWGDLSEYNTERSRGIEHRPGWAAFMAGKNELYDDVQHQSYLDAGFVPFFDSSGRVIGYSGGNKNRTTLLWDEAGITERFGDRARNAFHYVYDREHDVVTPTQGEGRD